MQGRTKPGKIVTWTLHSKHNYLPSQAIDIIPYPVAWENIEQFIMLADHIKKTAQKLNINIKWGGDFQRTKDYPHFEMED